MAESIVRNLASLEPERTESVLGSLLRRGVISKLRQVSWGTIVLEDGGETHRFGNGEGGPSVRVQVHSRLLYERVALGGTVGAGEAYIEGAWSCDDLTSLIRIFVRNREAMSGMERGIASLAMPALRLVHRLRRNTREGSRRNIAAHYDLGNDFYSLFLDETMTYSAGIFEREESTLHEASLAKIDRLCRKLDLGPQHHLLEIGTGWGGFAIRAAQQFGCRVTTTTISKRQYEMAVERVKAAGLEDRVEVLLEDYRDLRGEYDRIVSVEMIEAVGWEFYETFMRTCARLLRPDGIMALQAITIQDQIYDDARRSVDFIQKYIFPGCCIPSTTALISAATKASDLRLFHFEDLTPHYARTLAEWRRRFLDRADEVRAQGFDDAFIRMWEFYLCYCEGGFAERNIGLTQMVLTRPLCRREPIVGTLG